jgi:ligand-binding SRPBCC domain-containing protein
LPRAHFKVLLDAPLEAVWAFHEQIEQGLAALSPPGMGVRITRADKPAVGAQVVIHMKAPPLSWLGREMQWVAKYVEYTPPQGESPNRRAGFVDEQVQGPFKRWRHRHTFEEALDEGRTKVWAIDEVDYAAPLGPLGWVADRLFLRRQIARGFAYRQEIMRQRLCRPPPAG